MNDVVKQGMITALIAMVILSILAVGLVILI
jgi:hypothetical protein